jgi:hypothetical protein
MCVRWGPEFVMIYNDGYRSILGDRHPTAFGLPFHVAWPEVQSQLRPLHEAILNGTSGAFFAEDLLIKVQRRGLPDWEDARFTLSYSPIPDEAAPTGVLAAYKLCRRGYSWCISLASNFGLSDSCYVSLIAPGASFRN